MTTAYITKYALTKGPLEVDGTLCSETMFKWNVVNGYVDCAHGKDFWLTKEEAIADCERRRQTKLASIEKQKKKLEKLEFKL